ncbi:c-type cytochrome [bacterium SCSIO 12643]|nr:c-type cytochrome [bacterium SCSIO 12643]
MSLKISINKYKVHLGVLSLFLVLAFSGFSQDGKTLFKANCAACHKIDKKLVGPALAGVEDRWESKENLIAWIKNSSEYLKNNPGDSYAQDLFKEYNQLQMAAMPLTDDEVNAILAYVAAPPAEKKQAPTQEVVTEAPAEDYTNIWLLAFTAIFLVVIGVLLNVKDSLKKLLLDLKGEEGLAAIGEVNDIGLSRMAQMGMWMDNNRKMVIAFAAVGFIVLLYIIWLPLFNVGVYTGYAPEQPIKFSHKIHAGDDGIDCVYCHFGAEKGRTSGIPPVNVCMNCHKGIESGKRWGTEEISKIYEAAGWDPENQKYNPRKQNPIEWVKIHNLPDHVYFNHSQHVVVGGVDCKECHGDVATFDYPMHQENDLTMGWCIECHRTKEVKMEGNPYYDKLHDQLVEKYKDQGLESFTVNQIGGIECAKCHY